MRHLWYGRYAEGAMKRVSKGVQGHAMRETDELLQTSLEALQRAVWANPACVAVPAHETKRRKRLEDEKREKDKEAQRTKFRSFFK